jgi:SAM-dependent methyltransferase
MDERHLRSAEQARRRIADGAHDRIAFRAALLAVPPAARDAWLDRVLGLGAPPDDGPELPRGCVPYLPCGVDALIEIIDRAEIGPTDVFVDVGSGVGRAMALVHLLSGASAIGIEIQSGLVQIARDVARVVSSRISNVHGDAVELAGRIMIGSVFFLYCPFSGERLQRLLTDLEAVAQTRPIRVCCVDVPLPECAWLAAEAAASGSVTVYRSAQRRFVGSGRGEHGLDQPAIEHEVIARVLEREA